MEDKSIIRVDNVTKLFKLPHEKSSSVKGVVVSAFRRRNKGFEMQKALSNVSFEVYPGEFFGIVGRNGGGKSTLLKILAGIYVPTSGSVSVRGKLTPFIELGVGFNPELSGRDNVFLNGALLGFNRKEMAEMYDEIVEFAELERFMDQKLKNYSSGMQVRLAFSIAIRAKSDILLLDEVLAVGDAAFQQKCYNYFEQLKREHKTVVFVSHDMNAITRFCTRAIYIDHGKMTHEGSPQEISDIYAEDNIAGSTQPKEKKGSKQKNQPKNPYKISMGMADETDDEIKLKFSYSAKSKEKFYVGVSVVKDGVSVAEITTADDKQLSNEGKLKLTIDKTPFNAGMYQVTAALYQAKNRELVAINANKVMFHVGNPDATKGAALKLRDTWEY